MLFPHPKIATLIIIPFLLAIANIVYDRLLVALGALVIEKYMIKINRRTRCLLLLIGFGFFVP